MLDRNSQIHTLQVTATHFQGPEVTEGATSGFLLSIRTLGR